MMLRMRSRLAATSAVAQRAASSLAAVFTTDGLSRSLPDQKTSSIIHEMRSYTVKTEHVPEYLRLSSGHLFKTRLAASRNLGFFMVESGGDLNRFVHFWEYEDMEHRRLVRAGLSENEIFLDYWRLVRPFVRTQTSQILEPLEAVYCPQSLTGGVFALQCLPYNYDNTVEGQARLQWLDNSDIVAAADVASPLRTVGAWTEVWGKECGRQWRLFRSDDGYKPFVDNRRLVAPFGGKTSILTPTDFSTMQ
jgi:hypothetical protein